MIEIEKYDFNLPKELIAQKPVEPRDKARLMILRKNKIHHKNFSQIIAEFQNNDVIILNNSKVIPSKMFGRKETGGKVEFLFIRDVSKKLEKENTWLVMIKGHGIRPGGKLYLKSKETKILGKIIKHIEGAKFLVTFFPHNNECISEIIRKNGIIALPPYIKRKYDDFKIYQTVYSKNEGSIAAPTAGLHFTNQLLSDLLKKGINVVYLTLHVSASSFVPITEKTLVKSPLDPEYYKIPNQTIKLYNEAVENNWNICVVGTTTLKAIESACNKEGYIEKSEEMSNLFISPGYKYRSKVSMFITNFHTPRSPPLLMVSAFYDWEKLRYAYETAIRNRYRFFSFGDAMLIYKNR
ncbi:MAG: tRNA preQ1(34) S-adenosylmethionine ribosyltransferase-isomerase QueA [Candidatus Lokiarchaeota archaeon]|nr:tRNA preQ1(34) S-adenosylmethionine ribosyltransferase-isomerase QueA [Candidatus Lokiarchaeota archaeon]